MTDHSENQYRRALIALLVVGAALHLLLAGLLPVTTLECEGWQHARHFAPGYFDRPPLWPWLIALVTGGSSWASVLAIRLPAILMAAATTVLLFRFVKEMSQVAAGWYAALLFNVSFLGFALGAVHLPDTPLSFFWLLTLAFLWRGLRAEDPGPRERLSIQLSGLPLGLALLTDYRSALLVVGLVLFLGADRRRRFWLGSPELWLALSMAAILFSPVLYWNYDHRWISFALREGRSSAGYGGWFLTWSLLAPILFLNPYVFGWIVSSLAAVWRGRLRMPEGAVRFLLSMSLPGLALFLLALPGGGFRAPYWPWFASLALLPFAAIWLAHRRGASSNPIPLGAAISAGAGLLLLIACSLQLTLGVVDLDAGHRGDPTFRALGARDPTSEALGWRELRRGLEELRSRDSSAGNRSRTFLFADRWSVASRLDLLIGAELGMRSAVVGEREPEPRLALMHPGNLYVRASGFLVAPSDEVGDASDVAFDRLRSSLERDFGHVSEPHIIDVRRGGKLAKQFAVYFCEKLRQAPVAPSEGERLEDRWFFAINNGLKSPLGDLLLGYPNWFGVGYVAGPLATLLLLGTWRRDRRRLWRDLVVILLAVLIAMLLVHGLKNICDRPRPTARFEALAANVNVQVHTMFEVNRRHSFPSGHTATAFVIATLLALLRRKTLVTCIASAIALLVGLSTIYVGAHLPLDVVGGAFVGALSVLFALRLVALWSRLEPPRREASNAS
jgi:membrane-associated phospholipid phosphatase